MYFFIFPCLITYFLSSLTLSPSLSFFFLHVPLYVPLFLCHFPFFSQRLESRCHFDRSMLWWICVCIHLYSHKIFVRPFYGSEGHEFGMGPSVLCSDPLGEKNAVCMCAVNMWFQCYKCTLVTKDWMSVCCGLECDVASVWFIINAIIFIIYMNGYSSWGALSYQGFVG